MNGVEQVGFAGTVAPADANNVAIEVKTAITVVFKLEDCYGAQLKHFCKIRAGRKMKD